jgi:hypothetical protein
VKHRHTIFHAHEGLVRIPKECTGTRYAELVFLFPVGYVGHVVHCSTYGARNVDALFFILGWDQRGFQKSAAGHVTLNMRFCIRWDLRVR